MVVAGGRLAGFDRPWCAPKPGIVLASGAARGGQDRQLRAVGRPGERVHPAGQIGQAPRLAARLRQEVDLNAVLPSLRLIGRHRLLFHDRPPIGQEGEGLAVRRETRMTVVLRAEGDLAGVARTVGRSQPDRLAVAVVRRGDGLDRERDESAVWREAWVGGDAEAIQVLGRRGAARWRGQAGSCGAGRGPVGHINLRRVRAVDDAPRRTASEWGRATGQSLPATIDRR